MKNFIIISILALSCSNNPETSSDLGTDLNHVNDGGTDAHNSNDSGDDHDIVQDTEPDAFNSPTSEECEKLKTAKSCFNAGCPIFSDVSVISYTNGVCGQAAAGTVCWTTESGEALAQGAVTHYSRVESNGSQTIVISPAGYEGVLGWESCSDQCLCASD